MTADNEMDIKETFQRSQKGHNNKAKLVASLKRRYDKVQWLASWCEHHCLQRLHLFYLWSWIALQDLLFMCKI